MAFRLSSLSRLYTIANFIFSDSRHAISSKISILVKSYLVNVINSMYESSNPINLQRPRYPLYRSTHKVIGHEIHSSKGCEAYSQKKIDWSHVIYQVRKQLQSFCDYFSPIYHIREKEKILNQYL